MFECEQVDKSVTPQHLIWKIRGTRLKYENSFHPVIIKTALKWVTIAFST